MVEVYHASTEQCSWVIVQPALRIFIGQIAAIGPYFQESARENSVGFIWQTSFHTPLALDLRVMASGPKGKVCVD